MKMRYSVTRVINCGNFESLRLEYELEGDIAKEEEMVRKVEKFI